MINIQEIVGVLIGLSTAVKYCDSLLRNKLVTLKVRLLLSSLSRARLSSPLGGKPQYVTVVDKPINTPCSLTRIAPYCERVWYARVYISRRMREADNKSRYISVSVVGVYVPRTSSLNDKHSCQLFRKASSLVLLSSSVSTANLSCLLETTFSSLRFLFNFTSLQSFESGQALFLVVFYFLIFTSSPQSSAFPSSVLPSLKLCVL